MAGRRSKDQRRQDDETLEQWLRRRVAEGTGIPIDPRMTLDLYDRMVVLEARVAELEARLPDDRPGDS
ncbi:hypothetical protein HY68_24080 [Streptomyces sp. AcH 505]|uniref:hypothetical protein n=1 Tax=Streptomyces sp. AcH 505 TaxID=352211 RepID=UPI0005919BAF|nr:hypothetical protein HY68_24080 [Streptomyces sp. AcH 505]